MKAMLIPVKIIVLLHVASFATCQAQLKPHFRKTYRYELIHPELYQSTIKSTASNQRPLESAFNLSPNTATQPAPALIPDILNDLFQQGPRVLKDVANTLIPSHLFIPSTINKPVFSFGQLENYKKDLEEEAMEEEQEQNSVTSKFGKSESKEPKLYVSVSSDLYNYNYTV